MAIEKSLYAAPQGLEELAAMDESMPGWEAFLAALDQ